MGRSVSYLALVVAIIALVISLYVAVQFIGMQSLETRLGRLETDSTERQVELDAELNSIKERAAWELKILQARGNLVQAQVELQLGENWDDALESVEDARQALQEASQSADPAAQAQIQQALARLETIQASIRQKSPDTDEQIQELLRDWNISAESRD